MPAVPELADVIAGLAIIAAAGVCAQQTEQLSAIAPYQTDHAG
jgi:hypothetical protein